MDPLNREILAGELKIDEGDKLKAYKDNSVPPKWTIGVGRNLDCVHGGALGISLAETAALKITRASCLLKGITPVQRDALLDNDLDGVFHDLDLFLPWWRKLDPVRQRVLANMCFNMGIVKLQGFHDTLKACEAGNYAAASVHMLDSAWAHQVKSRATRLAALMRLGVKK